MLAKRQSERICSASQSFPSRPASKQPSVNTRLCSGDTWPAATQPGAQRTTLRRGTSSGEGEDSPHGEESRLHSFLGLELPRSTEGVVESSRKNSLEFGSTTVFLAYFSP